MTLCVLPSTFETFRITLVDECGVPIPGPNAWVEDCVVSVGGTPNIQQGQDIDFRRANGSSCGYLRGRPSKRGRDMSINFWNLSPTALALMTGDSVIVDEDMEEIGWQECTDSIGRFALEAWQNVLAEDCPEGVEGTWIYWLWPWIDNAVFNPPNPIADVAWQLQVEGNTRTGSGWGQGPWDVRLTSDTVLPAPLPAPGVGSKCFAVPLITNLAPPEATCAAVTVPGS